MRTIGILGGMSWESTAIYYQHLNHMVRDARGGLHSAPVIIDSVNFAQMAVWQRAGDWHSAGEFLAQKAQCLQAAGCQAIAIATVNAADHLQLDGVAGRIAPGYAADIIAVDGDPTQDVETLMRVPFVMARGTVAKNE